jgi:hypothetical protein
VALLPAAKETLLSEDAPKKHPISVLGRGSKLVGGTVSVDVERKQVAELLVDGFFPQSSVTDRPARRRMSGFQEIGLPFESDTAVTRHLAAFLTAHGDARGGAADAWVQRRRVQADAFKRLMEIVASCPPRRRKTSSMIWHAVARPTTAGQSMAACGSAANAAALRRH